MPHLKRLFENINTPAAAMRANALNDWHAFKTEMDAEARRYVSAERNKPSVGRC
jgi:GST-like protein